MRFFKNWVLSLALLCAGSVSSQAGFIFDIGDVVTTPGSTVIVPVTVTTPDGTQFGSGNFNLGIDVQSAGNVIDPGLAFDATPISGSALFANPQLNTGVNAIFNLDGIANSGASSGGLLTSNVASTVFNLRFNVAGNVAAGTTYAINFSSNALTSVTNSSGVLLTLDAGGSGAGNTYSLRSGSITAVPEPSSFALAGVALVGAAMFVRRRRANATAA